MWGSDKKEVDDTVMDHERRITHLEGGMTNCEGKHRRHDDWKTAMGETQKRMADDLSKIVGLIETYAPMLKEQQDSKTANTVWGKRLLYAAAISGGIMTIGALISAAIVVLTK